MICAGNSPKASVLPHWHCVIVANQWNCVRGEPMPPRWFRPLLLNGTRLWGVLWRRCGRNQSMTVSRGNSPAYHRRMPPGYVWPAWSDSYCLLLWHLSCHELKKRNTQNSHIFFFCLNSGELVVLATANASSLFSSTSSHHSSSSSPTIRSY